MDDQRVLLRHFLAALAYRTQKALRDAPPNFSEFRPPLLVRTPHELIRHMDSVLGYARTFFIGGTYRPPVLPDLAAAVAHFHEILADVARHLELRTELRGITAEILLQGPFSDAMTHVGQLAMLRRLAGSPVLLRTSCSQPSTLPIWVSINRFLSVLTKIGRRDSENLRSKLFLLDDLRAFKISHDSLRASPQSRAAGLRSH
jgi:hypothetical protein